MTASWPQLELREIGNASVCAAGRLSRANQCHSGFRQWLSMLEPESRGAGLDQLCVAFPLNRTMEGTLRVLSEPLDSITADDIHQLSTDPVSEGAEFELKSDLPHKDGFGKDTWHSGGGIGDRARNEIADEIVAFANTTGGVLCLGINETKDHPKRANGIRPLPRVHELARCLRQAVQSVIEPPLPVLEAIGVATHANDSGVVLLRVPPSRRRPHRQLLSKEVFVRRADETARLSMREVQELTMQAVSDVTRVDTTIKDRRVQFRGELNDWLLKSRKGGEALRGAGLHLLAIPTTPLDLGRVVGRPRLTDLVVTTMAHFGANEFECTWTPPLLRAWKPSLRSIVNEISPSDVGRSFTH
jgi:Putative DNA-binding domain